MSTKFAKIEIPMFPKLMAKRIEISKKSEAGREYDITRIKSYLNHDLDNLYSINLSKNADEDTLFEVFRLFRNTEYSFYRIFDMALERMGSSSIIRKMVLVCEDIDAESISFKYQKLLNELKKGSKFLISSYGRHYILKLKEV